MHKLHQDSRRGGGRCGILHVRRLSTWQTWWRRSRHQEATSTSKNCIYQTSEHLEVRQIQAEDRVGILNSNVLSVWSQNVEGDSNWSQQTGHVSLHLVEESAEEILAQPSEQWRAVWSHRQYAGDRPHMSEKMVMVRACIEEKSWLHWHGHLKVRGGDVDQERHGEGKEQTRIAYTESCRCIGFGLGWMAWSCGRPQESSWAQWG